MQDKLRVVIVGPTPPPIHGGAVCVQMYLNSNKLREYFDLIHLNTSDRRELGTNFAFDLQNIYLALKHILLLLFICIIKNPKIVHIPISQGASGYFRDGIFIFVAKIFCEAKVIIHLHGSNFNAFYDKSSFMMKCFIDLSMKCCDKVIVLGNCIKWIFRNWFDENDIEVIPNGTTMNPDISNKFDRVRDYVLITYLSNLRPEKGLYELIMAFKSVIDKKLSAKLKIAGAWDTRYPEFKRNIESFIIDNNINSKIEFVGIVTGLEKESLLVNSDLFVLPSWNEGHPMAIIEAMSAANAVISTDVGAIPETVIDSETGFIVEKQDSQALANAIIKLVEDPETRNKMGKAGRMRYEEFYTEEKNIDNLIKVFEKALYEI